VQVFPTSTLSVAHFKSTLYVLSLATVVLLVVVVLVVVVVVASAVY